MFHASQPDLSKQTGKTNTGFISDANLFPELTGLMAKYSFAPKKNNAQHFVIDESLIEKIVKEARLQENETVLEIGAGTGFLTRELQKHCKVIAIESDETLFGLLENELEKKNLELVHADFLQHKLPEFTKIVSLPPYNISKKIMNRLFRLKFDSALLVFQKEFVQKLTALPGFWEYNAMSVLTQYYFEPSIVCRVSKNSFYPKPKPESVLLKLKSGKRFGEAKNEGYFQQFVKNVFRFGNKNLRKALLLSQPFLTEIIPDKKSFEKNIEALELGEKKVNLIEVKEFVKVFNKLL